MCITWHLTIGCTTHSLSRRIVRIRDEGQQLRRSLERFKARDVQRVQEQRERDELLRSQQQQQQQSNGDGGQLVVCMIRVICICIDAAVHVHVRLITFTFHIHRTFSETQAATVLDVQQDHMARQSSSLHRSVHQVDEYLSMGQESLVKLREQGVSLKVGNDRCSFFPYEV